MDSTDKIINTGNWFIVELIEQTEPSQIEASQENRRCTVWGNYLLIKAATMAEAYDKAETRGQDYNYTFRNEDGVELRNSFVGIGDLLPLYEDLQDGAEILWTDYGSVSARKAAGFVKAKAYWLSKEARRKARS